MELKLEVKAADLFPGLSADSEATHFFHGEIWLRAAPIRVMEPLLLSWLLTPWNLNWKFTVLPLKGTAHEKPCPCLCDQALHSFCKQELKLSLRGSYTGTTSISSSLSGAMAHRHICSCRTRNAGCGPCRRPYAPSSKTGVPPSLQAEMPTEEMLPDLGIGTTSVLHHFCTVQG